MKYDCDLNGSESFVEWLTTLTQKIISFLPTRQITLYCGVSYSISMVKFRRWSKIRGRSRNIDNKTTTFFTKHTAMLYLGKIGPSLI